jgi:cellulose synthase (UDP-forming)
MSFIRSKKFLHTLAFVTGIYILYYVWWRATYTLNYAALIFSILLLVAEIQGVINYFLYAMMTWDTKDDATLAQLAGVSVDVYVPTYNEDEKVLEATIVGCNHMRYEHKTWILDDGNRPAVKALAERMGCNYIARKENKHAKAGNINEALPKTQGEFIVVLDADTVPQPDFLEKTLGYFADPKVAIVQLPQEFYNLDSMQHNKSKRRYAMHAKQKATASWHEQQLFYHVIQPGKNRINATFWCGSPSVLRRAALQDVGGVATNVVTEDFLTSIRLNAKGWKIRYHHEALAFGIAPQSYHAFNVQRLRWAQGSMKIFFSRDNPLIKPGLTLRQRLSHFAAIFTYFDSYQKLIFYVAPAVYLMTNLLPVNVINGFDFMAHWLPYFLLTTLTIALLGRGYFKVIAVEKYNTLKMITFIKASLTFFMRKRNVFRVTPKEAGKSAKTQDARELRVHVAILCVVIVSMLFAIANTVFKMFISYTSLLGVGVALFWSCFNAYILFHALRDVLKRMYFRQDYRFPVKLECRVTGTDMQYIAKVSNISRGGLNISRLGANHIDNKTSVDIILPTGMLNVSGDVVYRSPAKDGAINIGIQFDDLPAAQREQLYYYLFVTAPRETYDKIHGLKPIQGSPQSRAIGEENPEESALPPVVEIDKSA